MGNGFLWLWRAQAFFGLNGDVEPQKICSSEIHGLLALKPACHLNDIIMFVTGMVPLFCIIDVEPLWELRIQTIETAKEDY